LLVDFLKWGQRWGQTARGGLAPAIHVGDTKTARKPAVAAVAGRLDIVVAEAVASQAPTLAKS
jgi:hypothetical protein